MSRKRWSITSNFICPKCGLEFPIPRNHGQQREKGHIKDLYCPTCNKVQKFREYTYNQAYKTLDGEIIEEKPMTDFKIIMEDGNSKEETKLYLKNGSMVFDKEEFVKNFNSYMIKWCFDRRRITRLKKMIDTDVPAPNWGVVNKNGKVYYIKYVH